MVVVYKVYGVDVADREDYITSVLYKNFLDYAKLWHVILNGESYYIIWLIYIGMYFDPADPAST